MDEYIKVKKSLNARMDTILFCLDRITKQHNPTKSFIYEEILHKLIPDEDDYNIITMIYFRPDKLKKIINERNRV